MLSPETSAIVAATTPLVRARQAGMLFQMWHRLGESTASGLLFDTFAAEDRLIGLLDAIIATAETDGAGDQRPKLLLRVSDEDRAMLRQSVEPALMNALAITLGTTATPAVLDAWRQAFRRLMSA